MGVRGSVFDLGGFFGSLFAGWSSDRLFGARRGPINIIFAVGIIFSVLLFWCVPKEGYPFLDSAAMFMIGFAVFGIRC